MKLRNKTTEELTDTEPRKDGIYLLNKYTNEMNKDTYMLEIVSKAREWKKTKSITTSSEVCKMLNALADKYLDDEE